MFFSCPFCASRYEADEDLVDQVVNCPNCKQEIVVTPDIDYGDQAEPKPANKPVAKSKTVPEPKRIPCEFCGEMIMSTAKLCRFCNRSTGKGEVIDPTSPNAVLLPLDPKLANKKQNWGIACWVTPIAMFFAWIGIRAFFDVFHWNLDFYLPIIVLLELSLFVFFLISIMYYLAYRIAHDIKCPCGFIGQPKIKTPSIFWLLFFWPGYFLIGTSCLCPKCGRKAV
jgi:hypothetical protein